MQAAPLCSICKQRPATRMIRMNLGTQLTGFYIVTSTYRRTYARFAVCEDDAQAIGELDRRRTLGLLGVVLGLIGAPLACVMTYTQLVSGPPMSILSGLLILGLLALAGACAVISIRAGAAYTEVKKIVTDNLRQQGKDASTENVRHQGRSHVWPWRG